MHHFQRRYLRLLVLCVCWSTRSLFAHDLGLHCLDGSHPEYETPNITAIEGPFELHLQLRILEPELQSTSTTSDDSSQSSSPPILSFTDGRSTRLTLHLQDRNTLVWASYQNHQGDQPQQQRVETLVQRTGQSLLHTLKMGMDENGQLWMGSRTSSQPTNNIENPTLPAVDVQHQVLPSPSEPWTIASLGEGFPGAILGLKLWNTRTHGARSLSFRHLDHWNLPGQILHGSFVAHFYARFDDLTTRQWQHVFDMGTNDDDNNNDNIQVAQVGSTRDLMLSYVHAEERHECRARDVLVEAEMAFWHVGAEPNGTMWIQKNDARVATCDEDKPLPRNVFRRKMRFGEAGGGGKSTPASDALNGVVLGFRIDHHHES